MACALVMELNRADMSSHSSCWKNQMPLTSCGRAESLARQRELKLKLAEEILADVLGV